MPGCTGITSTGVSEWPNAPRDCTGTSRTGFGSFCFVTWRKVDWDVMVTSALLSAIHVLTLALGLGAVFMRGRALARPLDEAGWQRLLAADNLWGIAAGLWIASGLGRVFFGGKKPSFYWHNGWFWVKMALFGLVFALEAAPMTTFIRV